MRRPAALLLPLLLAFAGSASAATELISVLENGIAAGGSASAPSISGDGRFVGYVTSTKISAEDTNGRAQVDVYLRDRVAKTTRLISGLKGGDQPVVAADGRSIAFRALDQFPKVRFLDLRRPLAIPETVSYSYQGAGSLRYGDLPTITPDGHFVSFTFRGDSTSGPRFTLLSLVDATAPAGSRINAGTSLTDSLNLKTTNRSAMTRDAKFFFFETKDPLFNEPGDNGNQTPDIYRIDDMGNPRRISRTEGNPDESSFNPNFSVRDPALSSDGQTLFFISGRALSLSDTDNKNTVYRTRFALGNNPVTEPVDLGPLTPLFLSPQATGNGEFLVFTARTNKGGIGFFITRLSDGAILPLGTGSGAPAISADNGSIAFSTTASFSSKDRNGQGDIYVVDNPFENARLATPSVTLNWNNQPSGSNSIPSTTAANLSATASSGAGLQYLQIEIDGIVRNRVNNSSSLAASNYALERGVHTIRATALDNNNIPGESAEITITATAPTSQVLFQGITGLTRTGGLDNDPAIFSGVARIQNNTINPALNRQLVITEAPVDEAWETFGSETDPLIREEQVLQVIDLPAIKSKATIERAFSGVTRAPEVAPGTNFRGAGYTVTITLRTKGSTTGERIDLFTVLPRLNEETPGPNGGVPVPGDTTADGNFSPDQVDSIAIVNAAPIAIAGGTSKVLQARVKLKPNDDTKACTPTWSVSGAGVSAAINAAGKLTVGNVAATRTVNVTATFAGKSVTTPVTVRPTTPKLSLRATPAQVGEDVGAAAGNFRILLSPKPKVPVTVTYTVAGLADAGFDYQALPVSVDIPANTTAFDLPISPISDDQAEGLESIRLTLQPSSDYRLGSAPTATMQIIDGEPIQGDQPEATIRKGNGKEIGRGVFTGTTFAREQQIAVNATRNRAVSFTLTFSNPTNFAEDLIITGPPDFNGFIIQYKRGSTDVTASVTDLSGFTIPAVGPGAFTRLTLKITPTDATPLQAVLECPVQVTSDGGLSDVVQATVTRVR